MLIGELAQKTGLSKDKICLYEKMGLIEAEARQARSPSFLLQQEWVGIDAVCAKLSRSLPNLTFRSIAAICLWIGVLRKVIWHNFYSFSHHSLT